MKTFKIYESFSFFVSVGSRMYWYGFESRLVDEDWVVTVPAKGTIATSVGTVVNIVRSLASVGCGRTAKKC